MRLESKEMKEEKRKNFSIEDDNFNVLPDESLVKMAQEGSLTAEEFLIDKYKELVKKRAHLYFIVGGDRDDVIQEGMIGIFKAIQSFDEEKEASFRTYVQTCIKGQIFNAIKGANRLKHQPLNESISIDEEGENRLDQIIIQGAEADPEERLILKELLELLMDDQKKGFSKAEGEVLDLMLEGHNRKEISKILDKPYKSIDNTMQRIKKKISERYSLL